MYYHLLRTPQPVRPALDYLRTVADTVPVILFESAAVAPIYGRRSVLAVDPVVEIIGQAETFTITALRPGGENLLRLLTPADFSLAHNVEFTPRRISGTVPRQLQLLSEAERHQQTNIASVIRILLQRLATSDPYFGCYGAFSYDFVRLFEELPNLHSLTSAPDFHLYIPDLIYVVDHLKKTAELRYYQLTNQSLSQRLDQIPQAAAAWQFSVGPMQSTMNRAAYEAGVRHAQEYMRQGDIFELVLSRSFTGSFQGSSLGLYQSYRDVNPSPYMFYVHSPECTVLGASPEMFVRVEDSIVTTRPISGTAKRSLDPIEDYNLMLTLLNSQKEKSELDMLIDLGRNDLARVCLPGISVSDYRYIEKYSHVMHTIAHLTGRLDTQHYTAFDALIACLNAGTLTGTPKIRAMELIEQFEPHRRGYYGGCVGYVTFANELNTGIIIRSAVVEKNCVTTQVGATLLYNSLPQAEFEETSHKAAALMSVLQSSL